jgi:hypothetical protein
MPYAVMQSEEISHRGDFCLLANARGYLDAVEVGVDIGVFARTFLDRFKGHWLLLVDPYCQTTERPYDRILDAYTAVQGLSHHHGRFRFIRDRSPEAIPAVLSLIKPPGFVYIDGSHEESDVAEDLREWWKIIPDDGMIAGHDFDDAHPGVMSAVKGFAEKRDIVVRLTHETESPPSYYFYKNEPKTLHRRLYIECDIPTPYGL